LALGADVGGEDFGEIDPDDGSLGDGEGDDEGYEEGQEEVEVLAGVEDPGYAGQREATADGADEEERFAADLVDDGDAEEGGEEVRQADDDGLFGTGYGVEAGAGEDVVEVVKNRIDA